jgi:hypothetical protein
LLGVAWVLGVIEIVLLAEFSGLIIQTVEKFINYLF